MNDLDKRIAEEIMGEIKPPPPDEVKDIPIIVLDDGHLSDKGNWKIVTIYDEGDVPRWEPLPFSANWNHCMKALKNCKDMDFELFLDPYLDGDDVFVGYGVHVGIAEGKLDDGTPLDKVEKECNSLDDLPRVLCEAMLEYRDV